MVLSLHRYCIIWICLSKPLLYYNTNTFLYLVIFLFVVEISFDFTSIWGCLWWHIASWLSSTVGSQSRKATAATALLLRLETPQKSLGDSSQFRMFGFCFRKKTMNPKAWSNWVGFQYVSMFPCCNKQLSGAWCFQVVTCGEFVVWAQATGSDDLRPSFQCAIHPAPSIHPSIRHWPHPTFGWGQQQQNVEMSKVGRCFFCQNVRSLLIIQQLNSSSGWFCLKSSRGFIAYICTSTHFKSACRLLLLWSSDRFILTQCFVFFCR